MKPSLNEARYNIALERLADATGREQSELHEEITDEAEQLRSRG